MHLALPQYPAIAKQDKTVTARMSLGRPVPRLFVAPEDLLALTGQEEATPDELL